MAALIDAIDIKRKNFFEFENTPYVCLEAVVNTPTARGGQTLVRLKMRNLLTNAVFEKSFKANDKFKEPDLQSVPASYLYSDGDGSHFLDQETFETLTLSEQMVGDALDFLVEGAIVELRKYNGNPIGLDLPIFVELKISDTGPGIKGDTERERHEISKARNRPGDSRSALSERGRKSESVDRDSRIWRPRVKSIWKNLQSKICNLISAFSLLASALVRVIPAMPGDGWRVEVQRPSPNPLEVSKEIPGPFRI
jgi:elongation factor P